HHRRTGVRRRLHGTRRFHGVEVTWCGEQRRARSCKVRSVWFAEESSMTAERGSSQARWQHQFSEVDREIMKMASICGVDMLDRAQLRRALENDSNVCSRDNPAAFEKLHTLLKAHYLLRERAAEAVGEQAAQ